LNAEFQHFILRFNKISVLCSYHWKSGLGWFERRPKERVTFQITLLHHPQTIESPKSTHSETHIDIDNMSACTKGLAMLTNHCDSR